MEQLTQELIGIVCLTSPLYLNLLYAIKVKTTTIHEFRTIELVVVLPDYLYTVKAIVNYRF